MLTTVNAGALERYRAKKAQEQKTLFMQWHEKQSHFIEDVISDYWQEYIERQELVSYSERAKASLDKRLQERKSATAPQPATTMDCKALALVRPACFGRFESAVLYRASLQEKAQNKTRSARALATARALARAEKIQPTTTTDCFRRYNPHMKALKIFRLHDGKYQLVKRGSIPVRFHIEKEQEHFSGLTFKHTYIDRKKVKNMKHPTFMMFPDDTPITSTFMNELAGQLINEKAINFVYRALRTNYQQSGHPFIYVLLMQAQFEKYHAGALDKNCEVITACTTSKRYKDKLTGKMMLREHEILKQEIIRDDGKELDYTGKIQGETKVNLEKAVYQDVQDLLSIASKRLFDLMQCGAIQIPSDIEMQKGSVYTAINDFIDTSKKRWKKEENIVQTMDDGQEEKEVYIDCETMRYTDNYKSSLDAIMEELKATVSEHVSKAFQIDNALQAYLLSMDYDNCYIASLIGKDEKQVRRWINTVNDALHHESSIKRLMVNVL